MTRARVADGRNHDLIFDIGAHKGDDASFYLAKGFRVVAVEAHPLHAEAMRTRLKQAIDAGRLTVIEKGIHFERGVLPFHLHEHDDWSSFGKDERFRPGSYTTVEVEVIPFEQVVAAYGVPYYLKVDIEGLDAAVLTKLPVLETVPKFVSFEHHKQTPKCLDALVAAGYDSFKVVDQVLKDRHALPNPPREGQYVEREFTLLMSGAFGEEAMGEWMSADALARSLDELVFSGFSHWYDVHARHPR